MPIPKPKAEETKDKYVGRCMSEISGEYPQDQAVAICISTYDRKELSKQNFSDPQRRVQSKLNFDKKFEGINIVNLGENSDACWEGYIQVGTKILDGREVPDCRGPIEEAEMIELEKKADEVIQLKGINLQEGESYPWDECIADQTARYGDEEIAAKVCGMIKSKYGR